MAAVAAAAAAAVAAAITVAVSVVEKVANLFKGSSSSSESESLLAGLGRLPVAVLVVCEAVVVLSAEQVIALVEVMMALLV